MLRSNQRSIRPRLVIPVRSISCGPQPAISKAHRRAANTATRAIQKVSRQRREIALLASGNRRNGEQYFRHMGKSNGGNHDDCRISVCDCSDRLDCVGRIGAADAGKLSDANLVAKPN
jgi:hypothetical protein